jgi:hypothetical protein
VKRLAFLKHIRRFEALHWLIRIQGLGRLCKQEDFLSFYNMEDQIILKNKNFLTIIADIAIRNCEKRKYTPVDFTNKMLDKLPTPDDYLKAVKLYIEASGSQTLSSNLKRSFAIGLTAFSYEQVKQEVHPINLIGRLNLLYSPEIIKNHLGIDNRQIAFLFVWMFTHFNIDNRPVLQMSDFDFFIENNLISEVELKKFFDGFSISMECYTEEAQSRGMDENNIKCERLIKEKPIIKGILLGQDNGIFITSEHLLVELVGEKIFLKIFNKVTNQERFRQRFGTHFENYVRTLSEAAFGEHSLKPFTHDGKNAEFWVETNDCGIFVEAKLTHIEEKYFLEENIPRIDKLLEGRLREAFKQLAESLSHHNEVAKKYGIIVIFTDFETTHALNANFRERWGKSESEIPNNIFILSLTDYEILAANAPDKIIEILSRFEEYLNKPAGEQKPYKLILREIQSTFINPMLKQCFNEITAEIEEKLAKDKN